MKKIIILSLLLFFSISCYAAKTFCYSMSINVTRSSFDSRAKSSGMSPISGEQGPVWYNYSGQSKYGKVLMESRVKNNKVDKVIEHYSFGNPDKCDNTFAEMKSYIKKTYPGAVNKGNNTYSVDNGKATVTIKMDYSLFSGKYTITYTTSVN